MSACPVLPPLQRAAKETQDWMTDNEQGLQWRNLLFYLTQAFGKAGLHPGQILDGDWRSVVPLESSGGAGENAAEEVNAPAVFRSRAGLQYI